MFRIIYGTFFPTAVIMAEEYPPVPVHRRRSAISTCDQGVVGFLRELSVVRLIAAFDRDGILVTGLHRISDLIQRNALEDLPVIADDKMRTGTALMIVLKLFEITAVLCCTGAGGWQYNARKYYSPPSKDLPVWNIHLP